MSRSKPIKVGDILFLTFQNGSLICKVTAVGELKGPGKRKYRWEAEHVACLTGRDFLNDPIPIWFGPDRVSWKSVTNLGPCIPAAPEVPDAV